MYAPKEAVFSSPFCRNVKCLNQLGGFRKGPRPKHLTARGTLAGRAVPWQPVLGTATYPSCWQAWRLTVEPSSQPQVFELAITAKFGPGVRLAPKAHFIPE